MAVAETTIDSRTGEVVSLEPGALCRQCSIDGLTCCQPEYGITISLHDAKRLKRHTGRSLSEFAKINKIEDEELVEGLRVDKFFKKLFLGKRRLLQTKQRDVDCFFLGPKGCTVFEARPRLCRLHPLWFGKKKSSGHFFYYDAIDDESERAESDCLVVRHLWPDLDQAFDSIGETPKSLSFHSERMAAEALWQKRQIKKLLETKRPKEITLKDLEPLVDQAPELEV